MCIRDSDDPERGFADAPADPGDGFGVPAVAVRTDAETALRALVWLLARWADWRTPLLTRPTWAALMAGTGRRRSWLAARLAWLRERGLLAVVEHGSTPATRAGPLAGLAGNRAAVYLLTTPLPRSVDIGEPVGEPVPEAGEPVPAAAVEITEALPVEERWTPPKSRRDSVEPLEPDLVAGK